MTKAGDNSQIINGNLVVFGKSKDKTINADEENFLDEYLSTSQSIENKIQKKKFSVRATTKSNQDGTRIPWGYTCLNPLQMELRGKRVHDEHYWVMALDKRDTQDIAKGFGMYSSYNQELGVTEINLPKGFLERLKPYQGLNNLYAAEVKLTDEELSVIQDRKFDWFDWSVPFVFPALKALSFKDCLRNMEIRACESVINSIFLFKLGKRDSGV
jgi:hypothetical protein